MKPFGFSDYTLLALALLGFVLLRRARTKAKVEVHSAPKGQVDDDDKDSTRDIVHIMKENDKNCVVSYGSQTRTAEDFATRLTN